MLTQPQSFYLYSLLLAMSLITEIIVAKEMTARFDIPVSRGNLDTQVYLLPETEDESTAKGIILIRSPYLALYDYGYKVQHWQAQGFHVVLQSIIGTGKSTGQFQYLSTEEIKDGEMTLNWLSHQVFSNDTVVLFGESYDGFLALAAGLNHHPSVKAVIAASAPTDPLTDSFTAGGMVDFSLLKYYLDLSSSKSMSKLGFRRKIAQLYEQNTPLHRFDDAFNSQGFEDWDRIVEESFAVKFPNRGLNGRLGEIKVPVLFMAGEISDQDANDALLAFESRKQHYIGGNSDTLCPTTLAVGPWLHGAQTKLSRRVAHEFALATLDRSLECSFLHQVDSYSYKNDGSIFRQEYEDFSRGIYQTFSQSFERNDLEIGPLYDDHGLGDQGIFPLPQICDPSIKVSSGIERPIIQVPIHKNIRIAGPITIEATIVSPSQTALGLSAEIFVSRNGGWSSLDREYLMHRTRKRMVMEPNIPQKFSFKSPFMSLQLHAGDALVVSLQRGTMTANDCRDQDAIQWLMDQHHNLNVSFSYELIE
ncbi:MAG: CocE/NonD family hydrolase [Pseudobacteriovorax sp.]|nr:CocE/NonD family hydrolase [Pseudobacteriovorax sp.]